MLNKLFKCLLVLQSVLFISLLFAPAARAELRVDIIAGGVDPISVAVQKFETDGNISAKDAAMLRTVVEADLKSTGLFRIVGHDAFPEFVKMNDMPNFKSWMAIKTQVLVQAKMTAAPDGRYKVEFYVWDVNGQEQIEAQSLIANKKSARRLAHITADAVYERLTGETGYFDTQIIFIAETGPVDARVKRLAIMDQDGYGFRYMSDAKTFVMSPHFSPNMRTVVFLSYRNDDPMVWMLDMDTGEQKRLGRFGGMNFSPRFSPDGTRVALSLVKDGITNIHEYDLEKKTLRQVTFGKSIDTSPSYSPDGKKMAFNSNRSGSQQLHLLDLGTGEQQRLTYGAGRYATPAWSPDGQFIAFTKIADNTFYVGVMDTRGRNEKILAGGWFMETPSWAPGSRRIVYYETEKTMDDMERVSHIRSVDITGQNVYDIPLPEGINGVEPTWSPRLP
ncbi:MAG: Tol-Pal system beta propeller repeat protein TolB [Rickettsiales bacterium]|jgi:TolB protein|nr:Tol-Pal system beta propeller repeat protein TolB [Rickettsiales bacterium]